MSNTLLLILTPHTIEMNDHTSSSFLSQKDPCYLCIITLTYHFFKNNDEINDHFNAYLGFFIKHLRANRHEQIIFYHVISNMA